MTHDELSIEVNRRLQVALYNGDIPALHALRAVVELHKPAEAWGDTHCGFCYDLAWEPSGLEMDAKDFVYPCATIRAIEKELQ
jgi:hypothetical protein